MWTQTHQTHQTPTWGLTARSRRRVAAGAHSDELWSPWLANQGGAQELPLWGVDRSTVRWMERWCPFQKETCWVVESYVKVWKMRMCEGQSKLSGRFGVFWSVLCNSQAGIKVWFFQVIWEWVKNPRIWVPKRRRFPKTLRVLPSKRFLGFTDGSSQGNVKIQAQLPLAEQDL